MQSLKHLFVYSVLLVAMVSVPAQAADLASGTWKANISKSSWDPAGRTPKLTGTVTIKVTGDEITVVNQGSINAQGQKTRVEYKANFDGKDYPSTSTRDGKPNPDAGDTVAWKKIDDHTFEVVTKLKGQALVTSRRTISMDGKTFTYRVTGKTALGQAVNDTVVLERQ